jgi:hypothetical protein
MHFRNTTQKRFAQSRKDAKTQRFGRQQIDITFKALVKDNRFAPLRLCGFA